VVDFLVEESPTAAEKFIYRIDDSVGKLASHAELGRVVPELAKHNITRYREVVISPWRVFYRVDEKSIYVLAVIDGRRNVEDILLRRLMRG
jgi:toxin ParE1/3/4